MQISPVGHNGPSAKTFWVMAFSDQYSMSDGSGFASFSKKLRACMRMLLKCGIIGWEQVEIFGINLLGSK
jgi:hypothetical protein